jgi:hypothetical protein
MDKILEQYINKNGSWVPFEPSVNISNNWKEPENL